MAEDVRGLPPPQSVEEATKVIRDFLSRAFTDCKEPVLAQVHVTSVGGWACKVKVESKAREHGFAIPPMPEYADMIFEAGEKVSRLATKWGCTWNFPQDALKTPDHRPRIIAASEDMVPKKPLKMPERW